MITIEKQVKMKIIWDGWIFYFIFLSIFLRISFLFFSLLPHIHFEWRMDASFFIKILFYFMILLIGNLTDCRCWLHWRGRDWDKKMEFIKLWLGVGEGMIQMEIVNNFASNFHHQPIFRHLKAMKKPYFSFHSIYWNRNQIILIQKCWGFSLLHNSDFK